MVWTRRCIRFKGRIKKVDEIPSGEAVFKDDGAYHTARKKRIRKKSIVVLGWSLWIMFTTFYFFVFLGADELVWFFMPNGPPLVFLVGGIADLLLCMKMDSQVVIHEKGVLLKIPKGFIFNVTFLPFDQLNAIERKNKKLIFRGHRRKWIYWTILVDEIGEKGYEILMRRFEGWPEDQKPPRLFVYGADGHRVEEGGPLRETGND